MALTRIRVLNQQSTYNVNRLNANTLVVGGNNITGASGAGGGIVISSVVYLAANGTPLIANAAPTTGNSVIKIIGSGFAANANVFLNGLLQPSANVTFVDSTELRLNMPPLASNTYSLFTFNTAGAGAIFYSGVRFDPYPIWTTGTYSVFAVPVSTQLLVTGYGSGSISFSLASGNTLPSGLSLAANGILSGTTTEGTYNFYVNATDSENEITTQQITLTVLLGDTYFPYNSLLLSASSQSANNVSTETFVDSSNNNYSITNAGAPYQGSFSPFPTTGTWSNYFDGTGDYFTIPNSSNFDFPGNFTVELWFNFTSTPAAVAQTFVSNYKTGGSMGWALQFRGESNNVFRFGYGNTTILDSTTQTIIGNAWYHLAVTRIASTITLFLNGVSIGSTTNATSFESDQEVWVGGLTNIGQYFPGHISNLRVVKGTAVYTSNFTPSTSPLTAISNTVLLTCQSNRFKDNSNNNYAHTVFGDTRVQRFNPFGVNSISYSALTNSGSIYFNGSTDYLTVPSNASFSFGTGDFTVELWVYASPFSNSNGKMLIDSRPAGTNGPYWLLGTNTTGCPTFTTMTSGGTSISGSNSVANNSWNHISATRQGTSLKLFVNGVLAASGTDSSDISSTGLFVGVNAFYSQAADTYWAGYMSNIRITKGTALYTTTYTPSTIPLVPITNTSLLLLGANSKYYDSTTISDIKNSGGVASRTDIKNYGTNSWFFNGSSRLVIPANPVLNLTANFTIELWVYFSTTLPTYSELFCTSLNGTTGSGMTELYSDAYGSLSWYARGSTIMTSSSGAVASGAWYHIALVKNGTSQVLYVNGVSKASATSSTQPNVGYDWTIGDRMASAANGQYPMTGYIQDFRMTNGYARYTTAFTPPTTPFQLY